MSTAKLAALLLGETPPHEEEPELFRVIRETIETFAPGLGSILAEAVDVYRERGAAGHAQWLQAQRDAGHAPWIGNLPPNVRMLLRRLRANRDDEPASIALHAWLGGDGPDATLPDEAP